MEFTSITGYSYNEEGPYQMDFDGTEMAGFNQGSAIGSNDGLYFETKTYSQEFTLASVGDDELQWLIGAFYLKDEPTWDTGIGLPLFGLPFTETHVGVKTEGGAVFSNISYSLSDAFRLNLGLRFSHEKKERTSTLIVDGVITRGPEVDVESWNAFTPKLGIDYFINEDSMLYFSASRGFKSGGFDGSGSAFEPAVDPEFIDAYEVGIKTILLEERVKANLSAFYYDYKDLQVLSLVPGGATVITQLSNAAKATITGMDAEVTALISESLKLDIGLSILDAKFDEYVTTLDGVPFDASGNHLPQAPEYTANVGLEYRRYFDSLSGDLSLRADYFYSDEKFFDQYERASARQKSYELINASLTYQSTDGVWEVSAFGKNLTDELVISSALLFGLLGDGVISDINPPRTYGFAAKYSF